MDSLNQPLSDIVCKQLKQFIEEGRWLHTLPGINKLCSELQVSRQTMMLALRQLETENYVRPALPGKAREVNTKTARVTIKATTATVIAFISSVPMAQFGAVSRDLYELTKVECEQLHYQLKPITQSDIGTAAGVKNLEEVIIENKADLYVVHGAHRACSIRLRELNVPVIHIGGEQVKKCTPRLAFSIIDMCSQAIGYAKKLGHQRIVFFAPEAYNRRDQAIDPLLLGKLKVLFSLHRLPFSSFNCPYWGKTKEAFELALEDTFKMTPPTVIIVSNHVQVPRVISFLVKHKLKYPDDVSLIALDESAHNNEFVPPICYLKKTSSLMVELLMKEIAKMLAGKTEETDEPIIATTKLVITESVKDIRG